MVTWGEFARSRPDLAEAVSSVLLTRTTGHGDPRPAHTIWHAA